MNNIYFILQEHDKSILRVESYLRDKSMEDIQYSRVLYIRFPHPNVHKNHAQIQVQTK